MDLYGELHQLTQELRASLDMLSNNGKKYAESEYDYKVALNQCALKMKAEGMAIGLINLTVYGDKDVAMKRLKRDIAQTMYETNKERINSIKLEIKILQEQINKEWGSQ